MVLLHLALTFAMLSLLAVGGGTAVLPEMQSILLHEYDLTHDRFVHIYSLGQLAPGPNMLMVLVIGLQVAGLLGSAVVFLSFFIPSSVLCLFVGRLWIKMGDSPWRRAIQNALEPISIGLMVSGVYAVGKAAAVTPFTFGLALIAFIILARSKVNPVLIILAAGLLFALPQLL
jgi:chromate transporter